MLCWSKKRDSHFFEQYKLNSLHWAEPLEMYSRISSSWFQDDFCTFFITIADSLSLFVKNTAAKLSEFPPKQSILVIEIFFPFYQLPNDAGNLVRLTEELHGAVLISSSNSRRIKLFLPGLHTCSRCIILSLLDLRYCKCFGSSLPIVLINFFELQDLLFQILHNTHMYRTQCT